jgi:flagella basal body P-ring formation protein FlgA
MRAARPTRPPRRGLAAASALALALASIAGTAAAQAVPDDPLRAFVARQLPSGLGRAEISIGTLDPRLQLAPCARIEPYLLPGTRLWGRTSNGERCL